MDDHSFLSTPTISGMKFLSYQWMPYREQVLGVSEWNGPSYYRPLAHIVPAVCYHLFGNSFWKYHFFNLILLILAAFLVYSCVSLISQNSFLGFLTSVFYLIHPINGIMVNYITASIFSIQVILICSSLILLLKSWEEKENRIFYYLSLFCFVMALFCHETSIMIPFYMAIALGGVAHKSWHKFIYCLIPYFLILAAYLAFRACFVNHNDSIVHNLSLLHMNIGEYLATISSLFTWYLTKLFNPQGIVIIWLSSVIQKGSGLILVLGLLITIFILLLIIFRSQKIVSIGLWWFFIGFLPVGLAAFSHDNEGLIIEPHWFVFSSLGFFIMAAHCFLSVWSRLGPKLTSFLIISLVLSWVTISHAYNQVWNDDVSYGRFWSEQLPGFKTARFALAYGYQLEGKWLEAKKNYIQALKGQFDFRIFNNLGDLELQQGHLKDAEHYYRAILERKPSFADGWHNLGIVYSKYGDLNQAAQYFMRAASINPFMKRTQGSLINIFFKLKDRKNLTKYFYQYLKQEENPQALTNLGSQLAANQIFDLALASYQKAITVDPDYKDAYLETGKLFSNLGQFDEAIHMWELGSKIEPSDSRFNSYIAKVLAIKKKYSN